MNMKQYGICFKMRGGPDLLDCIQMNTPVPVDVMEQVISQMGSVSQEELDFAARLEQDWKRVFNERIPLLMEVSESGGYDITCTVPDELLRTVHLLTELDPEKIVEEYVDSHLKHVCGVDAQITSVDVVEEMETPAVCTESFEHGFDLSALAEGPEIPLEDISGIGLMEPEPEKTVELSEEEPAFSPEDLLEEDIVAGMEDSYEGDDVPLEEGYPQDEAFPETDEEEDDLQEEPSSETDEEEDVLQEEPFLETGEEKPEETEKDVMTREMIKIYREMVTNIRDRKLDERLGLRIGA